MSRTLAVSAFPDSCLVRPQLGPDPCVAASSPDGEQAKTPRGSRVKRTPLLAPLSPGRHQRTRPEEQRQNAAKRVPEHTEPVYYTSARAREAHYGCGPSHLCLCDGSLRGSSAHRTPWQQSAVTATAPISTKDTIAVLGISRRTPSPDYRILRDANRDIRSNNLRIVDNPPPRSTSLPEASPSFWSPQPSPLSSPSPLASRSPSPSMTVSDDSSSDIVFAQCKDDSLYTSRRHSTHAARLSLSLSPATSRSSSPSVLSHGAVTSDIHALLANEVTPSGSLRSRSSFPGKPPTNIKEPEEGFLFQPYSLMHGGSAMGWAAPTSLPPPRRPKSKPPKTAPEKGSSSSSSASADKSANLSFKRLKLPMLRRTNSISSTEILTPAPSTTPSPSFSPSSTTKAELVSESPGRGTGTSDDASSALTLVSDSARREESELESAETVHSDCAGVDGGVSAVAGAGEAKAEMMDSCAKTLDGQEQPKEKAPLVHNGSSRTTVKVVEGDRCIEAEVIDVIAALRMMKWAGPGK